MAECDDEVHLGLAKTVVVGVLKNNTSDKNIGIRADIDSLRIVEASGKPWSSQTHSGGYDSYTTIWLCAAKYLTETRHFDSTLHVIFQSVEELL